MRVSLTSVKQKDNEGTRLSSLRPAWTAIKACKFNFVSLPAKVCNFYIDRGKTNRDAREMVF